MIPVSLLASIREMRHVLGDTAAKMSSMSTRAVTLDTQTNVTSVTEKYSLNQIKHRSKFSVVSKLHYCPGINLNRISRKDLLPALPFFCRCSAASLTESCSTFEVMMCGRPLISLWWLSACSAARQFLQKCSTAV